MAFVRRHRMVLVPLFLVVVAGLGVAFLLRSGSEESAELQDSEPVVTSHRWEETVEARNDHMREWRVVRELEWTDAETGETRTEEIVSRVREVASSLCYQDDAGDWQPSVPEWEPTGNGFKADRGNYQVGFGGTLGAGYTKTVAGQQFWMRPRYLILGDGVRSVVLAQIDANATGKIDQNDPSKLVFADAFGRGLAADIEYVLERGSFHQNVVLHEALALPEGLNAATAQLYVYTELGLDTALADTSISVQCGGEDVVASLDGSLTPFSTDREISFRKTYEGDAGQPETQDLFAFGESQVYDSAANTPSQIDAERCLWRHPVDRTVYLVERVSHGWLADATYPVTLDYTSKSGTISSDQVWRADATYHVSDKVTLGAGVTLTIEPGTVVKFSEDWIDVAGAGSKIIAKGEPYNYIVFTSKHDNESGETISGSSGAPAEGDYGAAIVIDDDASSECTIEYCKIAYADYEAICVDNNRINPIKHCIIHDCSLGLQMHGPSWPDVVNNLIYDCSGHGINMWGPKAESETVTEICNNTIDGCNYGIRARVLNEGEGTYYPEFDIHDNIITNNNQGIHKHDQYGTFTLSNNAYHGNTTNVNEEDNINESDAITLTGSPYDAQPTGAYYLNDTSGGGADCRFAGSETYEDAELDNAAFTFQAPEEVDAAISTAVWAPKSSGDDWAGLDVTVGYHHNRIDYLVNDQVCEIEGGETLVIAPGTVVVVHKNNNDPLIRFDDAADEKPTLICNGTPDDFIVVSGKPEVSMRTEAYNGSSAWGSVIKGVLLNDPAGCDTPDASITYTRFIGLHRGIDVAKDSADEIRHCVFERGQVILFLTAAGCDISVSNCLFLYNIEGVIVDGDDTTAAATLTNCTFDGNEISILCREADGTTLTVEDCLLTNCDQGIWLSSEPATFNHDHNAFYKCDYYTNRMRIWLAYEELPYEGSVGSNSVTLDYDSPYDPDAQWDWPYLWCLDQDGDCVDAGSRTIGEAGLLLFTTEYGWPEDWLLDTADNPVDIGYHYPVATELALLDSDGDGLTNEQEVALGTDMYKADSDNDGLLDGWEVEYGLDPNDADSDDNGTDDGDEDPDGDGSTNSEEQSDGRDPTDPTSNDQGLKLISFYPPWPTDSNPDLKTYVSEPYITVKGTTNDRWLKPETPPWVHINNRAVCARLLGKSFEVSVPLKAGENLIFAEAWDVLGGYYTTKQTSVDAAPSVVVYDPSVEVYFELLSPGPFAVIRDEEGTAEPETHVAFRLRVKYPQADPGANPPKGIKVERVIITIGTTSRELVDPEWVQRTDTEWTMWISTYPFGVGRLPLEGGENTVSIAVYLRRDSEAVERPYRETHTIYYHEPYITWASEERSISGSDPDSDGVYDGEITWVHDWRWAEDWLDQNPFPREDIAFGTPVTVWSEADYQHHARANNQADPYSLSYQCDTNSSPALFMPGIGDTGSWQTSDTVVWPMTRLSYTLWEDKRLDDLDAVLRDALAVQGYDSAYITTDAQFPTRPAPFSDGFDGRYVIIFGDKDANYAGSYTQILADTSMAQYRIMDGVLKDPADLAFDYVVTSLASGSTYWMTAQAPSHNDEKYLFVSTQDGAEPFYVHIDDIAYFDASHPYSEATKNCLVADSATDITRDLTAWVSPLYCGGKVTWTIEEGGDVAYFAGGPPYTSNVSSSRIPAQNVAEMTLHIKAADDWPDPDTETYRVVIKAELHWPIGPEYPYGQDYETATDTITLMVTKSETILSCDVQDYVRSQIEGFPEYAVFLMWDGDNEVWAPTTEYLMTFEWQRDTTGEPPSNDSPDVPPLTAEERWRWYVSSRYSVDYPDVSPLYVYPTGPPEVEGRYWVRAVALPSEQVDWIVSRWQLVTVPRVDIDLVPDDPLDIGWVNVNDGDNQLTQIKVVCPLFVGGATAPDLVLTIPKGAHRIKLWKDEEGTQPISFNNATFMSGGNRFTHEDFFGNSHLSLYVEGIEASDELHDVEIMLSAAEDTYCMDMLTLTVVKIDLIEESLEYDYGEQNGEKEISPGAVILLNDDADSGTAPDHEQEDMDDARLAAERTGADPHYYDVRKLTLVCEPVEACEWGQLDLCFGVDVNVYRKKEGQWSKHNWTSITVEDPATEEYYYEGRGTDHGARFTLKFKPDGAPSFTMEDWVEVIVFDLYIEQDIGGFIPIYVRVFGTPDVLPGQRMALRAQCDYPPGEQLDVTGWQWTRPPGEIFKDYEMNANEALLTEIYAEDLDEQDLLYYWGDWDSSARDVTCQVEINGVQYKAEASFDVEEPPCTFNAPTVGATDIKDFTVYTPPGLAPGWYLGLFATPPAILPGIDFGANVQVPTGFQEGTWCYVQRDTPRRYAVDSGFTRYWGYYDIAGLDSFVPYTGFYDSDGDGQEDPQTTPWPTGVGQVVTRDSPMSGLNPAWNAYGIDGESFRMYIMFKPDGYETRFVPLKAVDWWFRGTATNSGGWVLSNIGKSNSPAPFVCHDHPRWSVNINPPGAAPPLCLCGPIRITLPADVKEGDPAVTGSVSIMAAQTVSIPVLLVSSDPGQLSVPPVVVIPSGSTSQSFDVNAVNDADKDGTQHVFVSAHANVIDPWGHDAFHDGRQSIAVRDNE